MQKLFILVFNGIYRITGKIDERVRNALVFLCCLLLTATYFFWTKSLDNIPGKTMIEGSAITAALTVFSIKGPMVKVPKNYLTYYTMVLFGIGILLIGQLHKVGDGYVMYALDLVFLFPALYFIWNSRGDHDTLYKMIAAGILLAGILSFIYIFYLACNGELVIKYGRVTGYKSNANFLGMMGVDVMIGSTYLLLMLNRNWLAVLLSSAGIGIGLTYTLLSVSRTALITVLGCGIVGFVFLFKMIRCGSMQKKRAIPLIAVIIMTVSVTTYFGTQIDNIHYKAVDARTSVEETAADGTDSAQQDSSGEPEELETITDRINTSGEINNYSSGRLERWRTYLKYTTPLGRPFEDIRDLEEMKWKDEKRAHNNIIEYLYRCGYIVGSIYVLFYIAVAYTGLKMLFSGKYKRPKDAFLVMVIGTYSVYAMLEISTLPFMRVLPCLFFLTIAPLMEKADTYLGNNEQDEQ